MRFLATIGGVLVALGLSLSTAQAICSSGVSRTVFLENGQGASGRSGVFLPERILRRNEVVLTFDDGPLPGPTTQILRTLDEHCVKATFFVVGAMARANPHLVRQMAARGHTVGTHTHSHANLTNFSRSRAIREIQRGYREVSAALGSRRPAPFFRFPYLAETASLRRFLAEHESVIFGAPLIDSRDWQGGSAASIRARILAELEEVGRGVILMHDIKRVTAEMLPDLLNDLEENGYAIVHLAPSGTADSLLTSVPGAGGSEDHAQNAGASTQRRFSTQSLEPGGTVSLNRLSLENTR